MKFPNHIFPVITLCIIALCITSCSDDNADTPPVDPINQ